MKRSLVVLIALCACVSSALAAGKDLLLLSQPGTDQALTDRVSKFCTAELYRIPVRTAVMKADARTSADLAKGAQAQMGKDDLVAVLLTSNVSESNTITVVSNTPVALVSLADPRKDGKAMDETYSRWVEREAMRAYGLLLGVKTCPNPNCAMSDYRVKPESLSSLGRNYCPYCKKIVGEQMKAKGVALAEAKRGKK